MTAEAVISGPDLSRDALDPADDLEVAPVSDDPFLLERRRDGLETHALGHLDLFPGLFT